MTAATSRIDSNFIVSGSHTYAASGTYDITIVIMDVDGSQTDIATSIEITWVNQAPTGANSTVNTFINTPYVFHLADFHFSDVDGNSFMAVKITSLPTVGTLYLDGNAVEAGQFISADDIADGKLTFEPLTDEMGSPYDSFTFQNQDDGGTDNGGLDLDPIVRTLTINVYDRNGVDND